LSNIYSGAASGAKEVSAPSKAKAAPTDAALDYTDIPVSQIRKVIYQTSLCNFIFLKFIVDDNLFPT
jgi:hypothetical protein